MKKSILLVVFAFFSTLTFSQSDAKQLLDEVSQKVKAYDNIAIDFKYVLHNKEEDIKQETRGDVVMEGDKYKLNILGITRIFDGTTLYSVSPEDEEVTVSKDNTDDENTITPSEMLSFYQDGYTYTMDIEQTVNGRKIQYVKLTPIDSNAEIKHVLLGIDAGTKHIYNLIETGSNNTTTTLTVNSFKTNEPLSKTLFTFDASQYKDYYINTID